MQTIPSLVGTGTAIAAAASGLVFGESLDHDIGAHARDATYSAHGPVYVTEEPQQYARPSILPSSRPGTSSFSPPTVLASDKQEVSRPPLSRYQRPRTSQLTSPRLPGRRPSRPSPAEPTRPFNTIAETPRNSISSTNSWLKRLSGRPLSQHGSLRSSVEPDSTSIATFSQGSSAPILSPSTATARSSAPNKLVKRTPGAPGDVQPSRPRSNSYLPVLRRPATSHQRTATLQLQHQSSPTVPAESARGSIDQAQAHELLPSPFERQHSTRTKSGWTSFFHSRASSNSGRSIGRIADINSPSRNDTVRRVSVYRDDHRQRPHLVKPDMVSPTPDTPTAASMAGRIAERRGQAETDASESADKTPSRPSTRRSLSRTLSSAGNWVTRTPGSLRRPTRASTPKDAGLRHVSDPSPSQGRISDRRGNPAEGSPADPSFDATQPGPKPGSATKSTSPALRRNVSSPLPPLSGVSSFHGDFSRTASGGAVRVQSLRQIQPSGSSTSSTALSQHRGQQHELTSTMYGSEGDTRDFNSVDDDDTDFKSDTMFDSLRTGGSGRLHAVETPLGSMYDESPPSTAGNGKAKRLSIQEILGKDWEASSKISEEDENTQTPVRERKTATHLDTEYGFAGKDHGRFSIDEDFDEDWTRDMDDAPYNALSPPSKGSSVNLTAVNPHVRLALANVCGNSVREALAGDRKAERPLSNIFDWSEPPAHDKADATGHGLRPQTAYAIQDVDARGGRSAIRKGPTPTHVRSQSVPVVQEAADETNAAAGSKYGTWGLGGTKTISEDWDDDFEFGGEDEIDGQDIDDRFAVPESIQAAQPSVKAHSGQIRELSLLVNDLQRLCRHGKEMDLLAGPQRSLWKEAEGIIALASPDDDDMAPDYDTSSSIELDFEAEDQISDDEFEPSSLEKLDAALTGREPIMSKTAVVRDRPSPRRRSVFSPDDDIFGAQWPLTEDNLQAARASRPRTPESRLIRSTDVNGVVKSVVEVMQQQQQQQQSIANSPQANGNAHRKMHFDTNSLKVLVKRAGDLRDILSDSIRQVDQITHSPARTPRHQRQLESSPAFVKVFDDPASSPPRRAVRSRTNTAMRDDASPDASPSNGVTRRMQLMTVQ
ncbi:uncharacterized protein F5Z01DRAFT_436241 [Emericellopsis atlantica]|uniref:Uncharacterized protein n=1 Tax=Emericellopsis atlantica TaxID=2614577 RepID=A0A9P7ZD57_9HYPO|nr:uncharacterized protein F5Z01DRAFT_436241 [Emericellopsis atlantica]KAG9249953.1 hypothetical protein F5Z01DRAFT_436241 [Emericellopsis atlantica]